jgi:hypothetical protein
MSSRGEWPVFEGRLPAHAPDAAAHSAAASRPSLFVVSLVVNPAGVRA